MPTSAAPTTAAAQTTAAPRELARALGIAHEVGGRPRAGAWLPPAGAVGLGMIIPFHAGAALALGALVLVGWRRLRPAAADRAAPLVGAGLIAGASAAGLVAALKAGRGREGAGWPGAAIRPAWLSGHVHRSRSGFVSAGVGGQERRWASYM